MLLLLGVPFVIYSYPLGPAWSSAITKEPLAANLFVSWVAQNETPLKPCV